MKLIRRPPAPSTSILWEAAGERAGEPLPLACAETVLDGSCQQKNIFGGERTGSK